MALDSWWLRPKHFSITFKFTHKTVLTENDIKWLRMIGCVNRVISYDPE